MSATRVFPIIATSTAFTLAGPVLADTKTHVCDFTNQLVANGGQAGIDKIGEILAWNPKGAEKVTASLAPLTQFNYTKSAAFTVADFAGISQEYFIVAATQNNSVMYVRLRFQMIKGQLRLYNVYFKNSYPEAMAKGAFAQTPVDLGC